MTTRFERDIRDLHGSDVEIVEMDGADRPAGRTYRMVRRPWKNPIPWMPVWLQMVVGLAGTLLCGALALVAALGLVSALWLLWIVFTSH